MDSFFVLSFFHAGKKDKKKVNVKIKNKATGRVGNSKHVMEGCSAKMRLEQTYLTYACKTLQSVCVYV